MTTIIFGGVVWACSPVQTGNVASTAPHSIPRKFIGRLHFATILPALSLATRRDHKNDQTVALGFTCGQPVELCRYGSRSNVPSSSEPVGRTRRGRAALTLRRCAILDENASLVSLSNRKSTAGRSTL